MAVLDWLLGRRLASDEQEQQQIGPLAGIPVLGLDALASAAYGPEAALTVLIPLGALGLGYVGPILAVIIGVLFIVYFSYRQTIAAYPGGGGSYTVAKANLGMMWGLTGGAALVLDYILNVAVGIAAGVGALVSAFPSLLPHTLALCLVILVLLTIVNLRGVRESGLVFMAPTYAFVVTLLIVMVVGVVKALASGGHPVPIVAPPAVAAATTTATRLDAGAGVRQRVHGDDGRRGRQQRRAALPEAHDSQRAARADRDHRRSSRSCSPASPTSRARTASPRPIRDSPATRASSRCWSPR